MSVKSCEKLEKSKVALTIEVSAEDFEAAINKAYLKMRGKMNIPGFRPGKAPRKIVESMYGAEVFYEEAVNIVLPDAYEKAVSDEKLEVVGYPEVELENCGKDGVTFKATVAVYPRGEAGPVQGPGGSQGQCKGHGRRCERTAKGNGRAQQPPGERGARCKEGRYRQHRL